MVSTTSNKLCHSLKEMADYHQINQINISLQDTDRRRRSETNPERMTMVQDVTAPGRNGADPFPTTTHYPSAAPEPVKLLGRHPSDGNQGKFSPASVVSLSKVNEADFLLPVKDGSDVMMDILLTDRPKRPSGSARPSRQASDKDEPAEIAECTYDVQRSSISSEKLPIRPSSSKKSELNLGMLSSDVAKLDVAAKSSVAKSDKEFGDDDDIRDADRDLKGHVTGASAVMHAMLQLDSKPIDVQTAAVSAFTFLIILVQLCLFIRRSVITRIGYTYSAAAHASRFFCRQRKIYVEIT